MFFCRRQLSLVRQGMPRGDACGKQSEGEAAKAPPRRFRKSDLCVVVSQLVVHNSGADLFSDNWYRSSRYEPSRKVEENTRSCYRSCVAVAVNFRSLYSCGDCKYI